MSSSLDFQAHVLQGCCPRTSLAHHCSAGLVRSSFEALSAHVLAVTQKGADIGQEDEERQGIQRARALLEAVWVITGVMSQSSLISLPPMLRESRARLVCPRPGAASARVWAGTAVLIMARV